MDVRPWQFAKLEVLSHTFGLSRSEVLRRGLGCITEAQLEKEKGSDSPATKEKCSPWVKRYEELLEAGEMKP